jgi:hypothetical protein
MKRFISIGTNPKRNRRASTGEGEQSAGGWEHRSCCKRAAFPAVMHMLSTGIPQGK